MNTYSYHVFYFPFKWELPGEEKKSFSEQIDLKHIPIDEYTLWERMQYDPAEKYIPSNDAETKGREELFGELQYYFDFVHPVLYDIKGAQHPIIYHYERREPREGNVEYRIVVKDKEYVLKVDAINLNLYATGVGILSFFLANNEESQKEELDVRNINQFGRRIMPPHSGEFERDGRNMLSKSITIKGLHGDSTRYTDCFNYKVHTTGEELHFGLSDTWKPAMFIDNLIKDLSPSMKVTPVIDDRMLVNCWYGNDKLSKQVKAMTENIKDEEFVLGDFWYRYVFVDEWDTESCQNSEMKKGLLKNSTYYRWQKQGTLYGISRYSMVALTDTSWFASNILAMHMRTIYSRMFELIIIQRASMLRFSGEVTKVSCLSRRTDRYLAECIGSLYQEYIRFINQIYFKNVTAQDQGIEMYDMLMQQFVSGEKIKELDEEIGELHQYITLLIDQKRNENGEWLNWLAAIFLPATVITGVFGMNPFKGDFSGWHMLFQILIIILVSALLYNNIKNRRIK